MSERPVTRINLERYRERLERVTSASAPPREPAAPAPPPAALVLLAELGASIARLPEGAGIEPLLQQVRVHVEALFPTTDETSLDEKAHAAHQESLEELFQTLEGVLYACSLPAR